MDDDVWQDAVDLLLRECRTVVMVLGDIRSNPGLRWEIARVQVVGLSIVNVVTSRRRNLHNEILSVLEKDAKLRMPDNSYLYAVAYRTVRRKRREEIEFWTMPLSLGADLATLPLALAGDLVLELDFETPYADTCRRRKLS